MKRHVPSRSSNGPVKTASFCLNLREKRLFRLPQCEYSNFNSACHRRAHMENSLEHKIGVYLVVLRMAIFWNELLG